jgi:hypothetical protein
MSDPPSKSYTYSVIGCRHMYTVNLYWDSDSPQSPILYNSHNHNTNTNPLTINSLILSQSPILSFSETRRINKPNTA